MGKKISLGNQSNYVEKVQHYLNDMLGMEVKVERTDSKYKVDFPSHNFTYTIGTMAYWDFAQGQHPGYVAQYIVNNFVPKNMIPNSFDNYEKFPKKEVTGFTVSSDQLKGSVTAWNAGADVATIKAQLQMAQNTIYSQHLNSGHVYKPKNFTVSPNASFDSLHAAFKQMQKAFMDAGKGMAQIANALGPVIAEAHKQAVLNQPAQAYVLGHPGLQKRQSCPALDCDEDDTLEQLIQHINDCHKWKREEIADWLDTLDEQPIFYPHIEGAENV